MKIKSVVYRKGFVEMEFSRGGNIWATLVIKPKDIIDNFHAAKQGVQRTANPGGLDDTEMQEGE